MALVLADTDVLIDFLRGAGEAERVRFAINQRTLCTSSISAFELWAGSHTEKQISATRSLLLALQIIQCDSTIAEQAGQIWRALKKSGTAIGMADTLIAATALVLGAPILTRNKSHFKRVSQVRFA